MPSVLAYGVVVTLPQKIKTELRTLIHRLYKIEIDPAFENLDLFRVQI